jgi:hypothetical protein
MKFWEAMKLLDEGKKVRRDIWFTGLHVYKSSTREGIIMKHGTDPEDEEVYDLLIPDGVSNDWEVYDDKEIL